MSDKLRSTYIYPIDTHGEITAHLNDFIISQESFACSIGLELGVDGMRPFFLHLNDAELAVRHPTEVRNAFNFTINININKLKIIIILSKLLYIYNTTIIHILYTMADSSNSTMIVLVLVPSTMYYYYYYDSTIVLASYYDSTSPNIHTNTIL